MPDPNATTSPVVPEPQDTDAGTPPDVQAAPAPAAGSMTPPITENQPATAPKRPVPNGEDLTLHHGVLGDIFQTLAGGKKKEWTQTENGPVATYRDLRPGEMARGILAAAITGLAGGYDPANRGKGPAMSDAFSGGFKANQQRVEKQDSQESKEAQDQFKNNNLSEEMALRKHADARAQQESLLNMQHTQGQMNDMIERARQGKVLFEEGQKDRISQQNNAWYEKLNTGFQRIPHPENPGETFGFATSDEATAALNKYKTQLIRPGDFNTIVLLDPTTAKWVPLVKPKNYDEKEELRFAKMKPDGITPETDSKGNPIAMGYHNADGSIKQPIVMTGREYTAALHEGVVLAKDNAETRQHIAEAEKAEYEMRQSKDVFDASNRMYAAGNDPWKVDTDTLKPFMTEKDRAILHTAAAVDASRYKESLVYEQKVLEGMDPNSPAGVEQRLKTDRAQKGLDDATRRMSEFGGRINKSEALSNSFAEDHTNEKGTINEDAAMKDFDTKTAKLAKGAGYTPQEIANARAYLQKKIQDQAAKKNAATASPEAKPPAPGLQMGPVERGYFHSGMAGGPLGTKVAKVPEKTVEQSTKILADLDAMNSPGQRAAYIDKLDVQESTKAMLRKAASTTENVTTRKVIMLNDNNKLGTVDEKDVDMYLKQGYSIPPAGYKPTQP